MDTEQVVQALGPWQVAAEGSGLSPELLAKPRLPHLTQAFCEDSTPGGVEGEGPGGATGRPPGETVGVKPGLSVQPPRQGNGVQHPFWHSQPAQGREGRCCPG